MNNIICITSPKSVGGTFVDWSINFLSGQQQVYQVAKQQYLPVVDNPLLTEVHSVTNAHKHPKNHTFGYQETADTIEHLKKQPPGVYTIYPCPLRPKQAGILSGVEWTSEQITSALLKDLYRYQMQDYTRLFELCDQPQIKLIYIFSSPEINLYHVEPRTLARLVRSDTAADSLETLKDEFDEIFFKESQQKWVALNNIWDLREKQALNLRPFEIAPDPEIDFNRPHLWIDSRMLWISGQAVMEKIMNYVGLSIVSNRLSSWLPIYYEWQKIHTRRLEFCYTVQHIVDAIVNNWDYELNDLSFEQEVVIQHCLIYQKGLNLKTWQLTKFPKNTKDLHKLLEPNIHPISLTY